MNWFRNLKISAKIIFGFAIVIALTAILAVISYFQIRSVDNNYTYVVEYPVDRLQYILEARGEISNLRRLVINAALYAGEEQTISSIKKNMVETAALINEAPTPSPNLT